MLSLPALQKLGVTPARLALIGVLAAVLAGVIVWQLSAEAPDTVAATADADTAQPSASDAPAGGESVRHGSSPETSANLAAWPKLALERITQHDPFRLPPALRRELGHGLDSPQSPQEDQNQKLLSELTTTGVGMVVVSGDQRFARIGATTVRPGDKIAGYRVWKIDAQGVWLVDDKTSPE